MNSMTKAEMQAEIDRLTKKVAELEGEVKGLHFALAHLPVPEPAPAPYYPDKTWTWPNAVSPVWNSPQPYNIS